MAEKSLVRGTESGVLDAEAMVRGMLRAIEHLGLEQPASPSSVVLEELPKAAEALALPPPTAPAATPMLRRPKAASAADPGGAAPTMEEGQAGSTAVPIDKRAPTVPETVMPGTSEEGHQPSQMTARWATLER